MIHPHHQQQLTPAQKAKVFRGFRITSFVVMALIVTIFMVGCTENYSNGERIGLITQYSNTGIFWKSWEGELHVTQTGMNSTMKDFDFSIDNDHPDSSVISQINSAAQNGWKVKLIYHETFGKNWFHNRGETNHFITAVEILDKNPVGNLFGKQDSMRNGRIVDTIYVVIDRSK